MKDTKLGSKVKEIITGFEGVVQSWTRHITGCDTYEVQPRVKDGKLPSSAWFDEMRVIGVQDEVRDLLPAKSQVADGTEIELGREVVSQMTGFKGIVTGINLNISGRLIYAVMPKVDKDGKQQDPEWFGHHDLKVTGVGLDLDINKAEDSEQGSEKDTKTKSGACDNPSKDRG